MKYLEYAVTAMKLAMITVAISVVTVILLSWAILPAAVKSEIPEEVHTRGPAQSTESPGWTSMLDRLRQEEAGAPMTIATTWLQSPVQVTGEIPIWGVLTFIVTGIVIGVGIVITMRQQVAVLTSELKSHKEMAAIQFASILLQVKELREDIQLTKGKK